MYSLLENVDKKIRIFIIHKDNNFLDSLSKKIVNHKNLESLQVYKFDKKNIKFPNLNNNHISEATYYRIFIEDYLPKNVENILYLDADIVCFNDPLDEINQITSEIIFKNLTVAAKTEHFKNSENENIFEDLLMKSNAYFNAGVMIINLTSWKKLNIKEKLIDALQTLHENLFLLKYARNRQTKN